jgi:hypothetical protein
MHESAALPLWGDLEKLRLKCDSEEADTAFFLQKALELPQVSSNRRRFK